MAQELLRIGLEFCSFQAAYLRGSRRYLLSDRADDIEAIEPCYDINFNKRLVMKNAAQDLGPNNCIFDFCLGPV